MTIPGNCIEEQSSKSDHANQAHLSNGNKAHTDIIHLQIHTQVYLYNAYAFAYAQFAYTCTHAYTAHVHIHTYTHIHMHIYKYIHVYISIHAIVHTSIYPYTD